MPAHSTLTGSDLHEPKGAAGASIDTVYVSNGAGSGAWAKIDSANIDTASIFNSNKHVITVQMADVSAASSVYVGVPFACTLIKVVAVLQSAITTADATVTVRNHAGTSMGTITVAFSGSAAGDVDTLAPSSNNTFSANERVQIQTDGASSTTAIEVFTLEFTRTGA